jgi:hypothetical protein
MYMSSIKMIISIVAISVLAGCGGGGSDSGSSNNGNNGNNGNGGNVTYVAGEFKSADTTGKYLTRDTDAFANGGLECAQTYNYNYFESANVLVYGDPSLPNTDFQYAATLVENNLSNAFSLMGVTHAEFNQSRPQYPPSIVNNVITGYLEEHVVTTDSGTETKDISDIDSDFPAPANWDDMSYSSRLSAIKGYWNTISDDKQAAFLVAYGELLSFDAIDGQEIPEKIVVCLDQSKDSGIYGQGSLLGMNIAPQSKADRSDASQVVLHELIHTVQLNVSLPVDSAIAVNDHWFMEGQATYLAGQKTASSFDGYYPVNVVGFYEEEQHFSDSGLAYEHYAKAYSYLATQNGSSVLLGLLNDVRTYTGEVLVEAGNGVSSDRFRHAFDQNIKDSKDEQLTLENFRSNYHSIVRGGL